MVTEEQIFEALRTCYDPEIPVNIVDLGLIYDVKITDDKVNMKMTLTARGCPMSTHMAEDARQKIMAVPEVKGADVEVVWDPPWNPDMISVEGKKRLGLPVDEK